MHVQIVSLSAELEKFPKTFALVLSAAICVSALKQSLRFALNLKSKASKRERRWGHVEWQSWFWG
jgi:hypothetical protein